MIDLLHDGIQAVPRCFEFEIHEQRKCNNSFHWVFFSVTDKTVTGNILHHKLLHRQCITIVAESKF